TRAVTAARGRPQALSARRLLCERRAGRARRPGAQQLQLQPQLLDLKLRRPVAAVGHGARGESVDEGDERAQHVVTLRRGPLCPLRPALREAALEETQVLAVHPGVDALQPLVGADLSPEGGPERALGAPVLVDGQRLREEREQIRPPAPRRRLGEALLDAPQN